jgi:mannitol-specific phosphotransferase system IIBC component
MEECSECKKKFNLKTPVKCVLCNLKFCCINCLLIHSEDHPKKKEQLQTENLKINGKSRNLQNLTEIPSFITEGIFQEKNKFNQNYQMKYLIVFPCLKEIGSGSFGKVYLMKNKLNNEICAIKIINKKEILELYGNYDILYNEISIHSRLIHKNIIRLYNVHEDKNHIKMIMEYALNGNLFNKIRQ